MLASADTSCSSNYSKIVAIVLAISILICCMPLTFSKTAYYMGLITGISLAFTNTTKWLRLLTCVSTIICANSTFCQILLLICCAFKIVMFANSLITPSKLLCKKLCEIHALAGKQEVINWTMHLPFLNHQKTGRS